MKDPYRDHLYGESEKHTKWRLGRPPQYNNIVFEAGRSKVWPEGSLEETVQNLVKTWEMEFSHKVNLEDFKTIDHESFTLAANGRVPMQAEEVVKLGTYNILLESNAPGIYDSSKETFESSHHTFHTVFSKGFAWEVLQVYSGPPVVAFKWRHWGKMEGEFKGHAATGEVVDLIGIAIAKVNNELKLTSVELFFDQTQFLDKLSAGGNIKVELGSGGSRGCPFFGSKLKSSQASRSEMDPRTLLCTR